MLKSSGSCAAQQMGLVDVNYDDMKIVAEQDPTKLNALTSSKLNVTEVPSNACPMSLEPMQGTMEQITSKYWHVFEGLGQLGPKLHLELDQTVEASTTSSQKDPRIHERPTDPSLT